MKYMRFLHPTLHQGENTTFRTEKWNHARAGDELFLIAWNGRLLDEAVVISNERLRLADVSSEMLDKSGCLLPNKTTFGLRFALQQVYKRNFSYEDYIYVITFLIE